MADNKPVRVGIIGLGFMGKMHYGVYKANPRAQLVAIADVDPKKLAGDWSAIGGNINDPSARNVDLGGIKTYRNAASLIADPEVDLVDITLPTSMHAEWAVKALKAGKHLLCEKPMARTTKEARKVLAVARRAKGMAMVAHCIRFWPEYSVTKQLVQQKTYGKVLSASFRRLSAAPTWGWNNWLMNGRMSGGALLDLHIHDVDYVQYLFGKPRAVFARGIIGKMSKGGVDHVVANYVYPGIRQVMAEGAWGFEPAFPFEMSFNIVCEKATISFSTSATPAFRIYLPGGKIENPKAPPGDGYSNEMDYFLGCIHSGKKPKVVTLDDAMRAVLIAEAEVASIKTGKIVKI